MSPPVSSVLVLEDWSYSVPPVLATSPVPTHDTLELPAQAHRVILNNTMAAEQRKKIEDSNGPRQIIIDNFDG